MAHLTGVSPPRERSSTDHVVCDPEVVVILTVVKDVYIDRLEYGGQLVAVQPSHTPATDGALGKVSQGWRVRVWQGGRLDNAVDVSWAVQLTHREHICFRFSTQTANSGCSNVLFLF